MHETRSYSDFSICRLRRAGPAPLTRRLVTFGAPALALAGTLPFQPASGQIMGAVNAINAVVGVITNIDALTDRIWPKVQHYFSASPVSAATVSRITHEIGTHLEDSRIQAVSITENRTARVRAGLIQHSYNQEFSQAYVDWCVCNSRVHEQAAEYWANMAEGAERQGQYALASRLRDRAEMDRGEADRFLRKLNGTVLDAPVQATLPPNKPMLIPVAAPDTVTGALDKGDYFVAHVTAQQRPASGLATI